MNDKTLWRVKYHGILKKNKKKNTQPTEPTEQ